MGLSESVRRIGVEPFHRRIRQGVPLLQEVDAQHPLQPNRTSAARARFWRLRIVRRDHRTQLCPGHHPIHLRQEHVPTRRLAGLLESGVMLHRQAHLFGGHRVRSGYRSRLRPLGKIRVSLVEAIAEVNRDSAYCASRDATLEQAIAKEAGEAVKREKDLQQKLIADKWARKERT